MNIVFAKKCVRCGSVSNTGFWVVCEDCQSAGVSTREFCLECGRKKGHTPQCEKYIPTSSEIKRVARKNPDYTPEDIADNYINNQRPFFAEKIRAKIINILRINGQKITNKFRIVKGEIENG